MAQKIERIKVLNIAQPNAHYVIFNGKNVENRSKAFNGRGSIAIYASKTMNKRRFENSKVKPEDCAFGAIIGFAEVVDCITEDQVTPATKKWFQGEYGYVLTNVIPLKTPIKVKPPNGAVTWWVLDGASLEKCLDQITASQLAALKPIPSETQPIRNKPPRKRSPKKPNALNQVWRVSPELSSIIGIKKGTGREIIVKLWDYINAQKLQNPKNKRKVRCDSKLKKVFGGAEVDVFAMEDHLNNHVMPELRED